MKRSSRILTSVLVAFCTIVLLAAPVMAQTVATLYSKEGSVEGKFGQKNAAWVPVSKDKEFSVTDSIKVGPKSRAGVMFVDGMLIRLKSYSFLRFDSYTPENPSEGEMTLEKGEAYLFSRKNKPHPRIKTPIVSAAIRGTEFLIRTDEDSTSIEVIDGSVEATNEHGTVLARKGERVDVTRGSAPVKSVLVDVEDSIQWALHYPSILVYDDVASHINADNSCWKAAVRGDMPHVVNNCKTAKDYTVLQAVALTESGSPSEAYTMLEGLKNPEPAVMLLRASMANSLGMMDEAERDLRQVRNHPGLLSGIAESQRAIIALVQDRRERVTPMMEYARSHAPDAASTAVATAFINQSLGDLDGAQESIEAALERSPENAFLLALYAEYLHGQEHMAEALEVSTRALELAPDQHYARLVHGFVLLTLGEYEDAKHDFHVVIESEKENPLAHFGMGLFYMHQGDEEQGLQHLERAVHIAPNTAIYRSYLGKAFFETDQNQRAINEYDIAIEKDDEDPTPYLYRAFSKLAENNVVGALRDVTKSMNRNDNRAVYRSKMSLDQDSAVRSASLSRIYNELQFREAGRIEAIKSISKDYTNFAAHRLLSAAYNGGSFFFNSAQLSEDRISTLLAPLSFNLFFGNGAADSFNEYTALFNKDEERTEISIDYRDLDDSGNATFVHAGKYGRIGYALEGSHIGAQGTKNKDFVRRYLYSSAVQWQPSYWHRFIAEGQYSYARLGAEDLTFDPNNRAQAADGRLSYRGKMNRNVQVLGTVGYTYGKDELDEFIIANPLLVTSDFNAPDIINTFDSRTLERLDLVDEEDYLFGEAQVIGQYSWITSVVGTLVSQSRTDSHDRSRIIDDAELPVALDENNNTLALNPITFAGLDWRYNERVSVDTEAITVYSYNTVHLTPWLDVIGGVSYQDVEYLLGSGSVPLDDTVTSFDSWSPKVGLLIDPIKNLLLRASYTENVIDGRARFNGSLEPTLVAGLNQRFTGLADVGQNEVYSFGIDYKVPGWTYVGAEFANNNTDSFFVSQFRQFSFDFADLSLDDGSVTQSRDVFFNSIDQDIFTAYFYQVLTDNLTFANSFKYFDGSNSEEGEGFIFDAEYKQLDSRLAYFHESGFTPMLVGTWIRSEERDAIFDLADNNTVLNLSDSNYTLSAALAYRFPNRRGFTQLQLNNLFGKKSKGTLDRFGVADDSQNEFNVRVLTTFNF